MVLVVVATCAKSQSIMWFELIMWFESMMFRNVIADPSHLSSSPACVQSVSF